MDYRKVEKVLSSWRKGLNGIDSLADTSQLCAADKNLLLEFLKLRYAILKDEQLDIVARLQASTDMLRFNTVDKYKLNIAELAVNYSCRARKTAKEETKIAESIMAYDVSLLERQIASLEQQTL